MNDKVTLKSNLHGEVIINLPELHFKRSLPKFGSKITMDKKIFDEAVYDIGFSNMIKDGAIFVEEMEAKKEHGFEPEDATEPVNIIDTDEKFFKRCATVMPIAEFKKVLNRLTQSQKQSLVIYFVDHVNDLKMDKINLVNTVCKVNIVKMAESQQELEG